AATTIYTLHAIRNLAGQQCATGGTVQVGVHPPASVSIHTERDTVCKNESVAFSASGAASYKWSNGATNTSFTLTAISLLPFNYTVTGTDANGCEDEASVSVIVSECPGLSEF